jgi:hypothetical protein
VINLAVPASCRWAIQVILCHRNHKVLRAGRRLRARYSFSRVVMLQLLRVALSGDVFNVAIVHSVTLIEIAAPGLPAPKHAASAPHVRPAAGSPALPNATTTGAHRRCCFPRRAGASLYTLGLLFPRRHLPRAKHTESQSTPASRAASPYSYILAHVPLAVPPQHAAAASPRPETRVWCTCTWVSASAPRWPGLRYAYACSCETVSTPADNDRTLRIYSLLHVYALSSNVGVILLRNCFPTCRQSVQAAHL